MKLTSSVGALLLASTALAAPAPSKLTQRRHERLAKRLANKHKTNPPLAVNHTSMKDTVAVNSPGFVEYDSNWAGAVIVSSGITEVTGTFTIPTVKEPSGGNSNTMYGAAAWVGIDGDTCQSAILQTGVEFLVEGDSTAYEAWYEWYPNYSYNFDNFDVSPGDQIKATVKATSLDSGTATLENLSTGSSVTHTFKNEASEGSLCETNAEWIVEDFESGDSLVPFANFGSVTFTDCSYVHDGTTSGVSGATILDVEQNGQVETSCGTSGSSEVYCDYTG
ncbi:hypothetical protein M433DRAFT_131865 [Acidomyces richmondensis BFW]|nr:MAG: hypothetical protein FE78DRAFT_66675 [Acidomyces sp. 'richmondensis']KYG48761.1 hypothetical protein M433DRAFT_131865 [Acidomyces richmondensis BFW]